MITRPLEDSLVLKEELEKRGYAAMIEPLLSIEPVDAPIVPSEEIQALALTSRHAVAALSDEAKRLPVYVVGEATAKSARAAGCREVIAAEGDALALARLIVASCRRDAGAILHVAGETFREELGKALTAAGFDHRRTIAYRAVPKERLTNAAIEAWRRRDIAAVLLFSPRTAETLVDLLRRHGLTRHVDSTAAICLSEKVAAPCKSLVWRLVRSAARPTREALIRALEGDVPLC